MNTLPLTFLKTGLLTKYKYFVRVNLDYADIVFDKPFNESFNKKKMIQYNAALMITDVIKGTLLDTLYQELDVELLGDRSWSRGGFFTKLHSLSFSHISIG